MSRKLNRIEKAAVDVLKSYETGIKVDAAENGFGVRAIGVRASCTGDTADDNKTATEIKMSLRALASFGTPKYIVEFNNSTEIGAKLAVNPYDTTVEGLVRAAAEESELRKLVEFLADHEINFPGAAQFRTTSKGK